MPVNIPLIRFKDSVLKIADIIAALESLAPPSLQESYDNAGLLTGQAGWECTGILCTLDAIEEVVEGSDHPEMQSRSGASSYHLRRT